MRVILIFLLCLSLSATAAAEEEEPAAGSGTNTDTGAGADTDADTGTGTGTDADTGTGTDTETGTVTDTVTVTGAGLPPKVAVVVAGDPDATLVAMATTVQDECVEAGLRTPADPALRAALEGTPGSPEDGLDAVRAIRRGLGVNPRKDLASYKRLGSITGADALVVLRREGDIKLEVFDVSASQFYEGVLDVDGTTTDLRVAYVRRRANTAQERWSAPAPIRDQTESGPATGALAVAEPVDEPKKKRWIKKAWPYMLVGALLVGGVTYIIVDQRRTNDPGPPLLRFTPGEE